MSPEEIKKKIGVYAADLIKTEMTIGLGTGSTVYWLIRELSQRVQQGLSLAVVPTSIQTERLAVQAGIAIADLNQIPGLSMTIDGADEIDPAGNMIKGGGGALLREKIVASASDELVIIADNTKLVPQLGRFPLPVEVISFGYKKLQEKIISSGLCRKCTLRQKDGRLFITDHQNYILDLECDAISDVVALNSKLHNMPGVVETGLFINMATRTIIGFADERIEDVAIKAKV